MIFFIAFGVLLDFLSCFLFMKRNRNGVGASGFPVVTLVVCYLLPLIISGRAVLTESVWLDCCLLFVFHVLVVFVIPAFDRRWLARSME